MKSLLFAFVSVLLCNFDLSFYVLYGGEVFSGVVPMGPGGPGLLNILKR